MDRRTKATLNRDKAVRLNEAWGVGAAQVRYSDDGHWYATLAQFPAALFDANGYVLFESGKAKQSRFCAEGGRAVVRRGAFGARRSPGGSRTAIFCARGRRWASGLAIAVP